eukprot:Blabericola_migrator_1__3956@NODE_21_length_22536_cov_99_458098_g18_i0_p10_GENE_NODE_21_length_22536_cov_99_458098_g18_i0NODE_21_length_22536_cov_99_458098_g18_i0_p10_ORF_typecomplete_len289_score49_29Peptidase_C97/PF05903_14/1_8e27PUB/PF09409_10/2_6PUB/PF09409_10/2_8e02PUB/PF09409_10/1_5e02LRAT/PF04970_13/0_45LRAT/PF04970_13/2_6e03_NODE_21_length_22536_cov_99_458098_g18_i011251991
MAEVKLKLYDLTKGMASQMSPFLLGKKINGVWHSALLVYEKEIFYGGGIVVMAPDRVEEVYDMKPSQALVIGKTKKSLEDIQAYLDSIDMQFTDEKYDVIKWNCNHFTNQVAKFLMNIPLDDPSQFGIPREIVHQHEAIADTKFGNFCLQMFQNYQKAMAAHYRETGKTSVWTKPGEQPAKPSDPKAFTKEAVIGHDELDNAVTAQLKSLQEGGLMTTEKILQDVLSEPSKPKTVGSDKVPSDVKQVLERVGYKETNGNLDLEVPDEKKLKELATILNATRDLLKSMK